MKKVEEAIRKIEGVRKMIAIGLREGFGMCNMKASEKKLEEALQDLKKKNDQSGRTSR